MVTTAQREAHQRGVRYDDAARAQALEARQTMSARQRALHDDALADTHAVVDRLWRDGLMTRERVYRDLVTGARLATPIAHLGGLSLAELARAKTWAQEVLAAHATRRTRTPA